MFSLALNTEGRVATLRQSLAVKRLRLSRLEETGKYKVLFHSAIKRYDHHFKSKESNLFDGKLSNQPEMLMFLDEKSRCVTMAS